MNSNDKDFNIETFYVIIDNNIPTQISPEKINDKSKYVIIRKIHYGSGFFYTAKKGKGYPEERAITFEQFKTAFDYLTQHTSENIMKNNSQTAKLIKYLGLSEEAPANIVNMIANVPIEAAAATEAKERAESKKANPNANSLLHKITSRPLKEYSVLPEITSKTSNNDQLPAQKRTKPNLDAVVINGVNDANSANGINYLDSLFNPTSNASTKNTLITPITPTNHTTVEREVNINNLSTLPNSNSSNANLLTSNSSTSATVAPSPRREAWKGGRKTRKNKKSKRKHTRRH